MSQVIGRPTNPPKKTINEEVRDEIVAVATRASEDDKRRVATVISKAKKGDYTSEIVNFTPSMAAIIFLEHNAHNRDWRAEGMKSCREYARRMSTGQWKRNNATIGFYRDGELEDGQHRLSGAATAGHTLETVVVYGIEHDATQTVDDLLPRHGADHAKLSGIQNSAAKQTIIRNYAAYWVKAGNKDAALRSESEVADAIKRHDELLNEAIDIGTASLVNIVDPVLKTAQAHTLAYLMLDSAWPTDRVREKLALFQTGVSADGEKTPYFVAAELLKTNRKRDSRKEHLSIIKELGVVIYAMQSAEQGTKAINQSNLRAVVKKTMPNPAYPSIAMAAE